MFLSSFFQISATTIKNIDKDLYQRSEKAKTCPICNKHYTRMVSHFTRSHRNDEVFVSRISQEMADKLIQSELTYVIRREVKKNKSLRGICVFCETERDLTRYQWIDHFCRHTGELGFKSINGKHALNGFLCNKCNFLQLNKANMVNHLKNQHEIQDVFGQYSIVTLLPAADRGK